MGPPELEYELAPRAIGLELTMCITSEKRVSSSPFVRLLLLSVAFSSLLVTLIKLSEEPL